MAPSWPGGRVGDQPTPDGMATGRAPEAWMAEASLLPAGGVLHLDLLRLVTGRFQTALRVDSSSPACTTHSRGAQKDVHVLGVTAVLVCTGVGLLEGGRHCVKVVSWLHVLLQQSQAQMPLYLPCKQ